MGYFVGFSASRLSFLSPESMILRADGIGLDIRFILKIFTEGGLKTLLILTTSGFFVFTC